MNGTNYGRLFCLLAFVAFAAVSCWATAESLHLLLNTWPMALCWIVTIGFFVIASYGSKLVVDSLNKNVYMEKRSLMLVLGIIIMLVFWLICSMPTNTHTFFYRTSINDIVTNDIAHTRNLLGQVKNNTNVNNIAQKKADDLKSKIEIKLGELEAEIKNESNPGFGPKSKEILRDFATLLGVDKVEPLTYIGSTPAERLKLCDAYRQKIYLLMESKIKDIKENVQKPSQDNVAEVKKIDNTLANIKKRIDEKELDLNDADAIKEVNDKLSEGYNIVKINKDFVQFDNEEDEAAYTADKPVTKVKHMVSVFDVWKDYLTGGFRGHGFLFWILISVLVDVAAFIFFTLALKKDY